MFRKSLISLTAACLAATLGGCSTYGTPGSLDVISEAYKSFPSDYQKSGLSGPKEGFGDSDPDSGFSATKTLADTSAKSWADECLTLFNFAKGFGLIGTVADSGGLNNYELNEQQSLLSCINSFAGYPDGGSAFFTIVGLNASPKILVTIDMQRPSTETLFVRVRSASSESLEVFQNVPNDPKSDFPESVLQAIAEARTASPQENPRSQRLIKNAIRDIVVEPNVAEISTDEKGNVIYLFLSGSSFSLPLCLAIDPWDDEIMGMADPSTSYSLRYVSKPENLKGFGSALTNYESTENNCPKS